MQYLMDTVALIRHFAGTGKVGRKASCILDGLEKTEDLLFISVISLMEVMYLSEKNRITISLKETLKSIESSESYCIVDLNSEILRVAETIEFPDLHDRLIIATAKWLLLPIISSDGEFSNVEGLEVIWK